MSALAEKNKYRFKGHESFILREGWLNKGLTEVSKNEKVFSENYGADALGVGPNMAKAIRYWLKCTGLTEEENGKGVILTDLGKIILENDPYTEDIFTLWLIHCQIARNQQNATAWNLFFNSFSYEEFKKTEMMAEMKELAVTFADGGKLSEASIEADCDAILRMYVKKREKNSNPEEKNTSPFGKLGLIKVSGDFYERKQPDLKNLPDEVVLYLLLLLDEKSIHIDELLNIANGPGKILQLKRTALMEKLEILEAKGFITLNRTAGLNMVYLNNAISDIKMVQKYYK